MPDRRTEGTPPVNGARPPGGSDGPDAPGPSIAERRSNIRSQDLVSLPVLRALLRERNVTRAGEVIGLTQSATSNALARLRRRFDDELLVRHGREYQLTPLAQSLLERADHAFDALERIFDKNFDPVTSTREFTVTLSDYVLVVLSSTLVPLVRQEAPGVRLNFRYLSTAVTAGWGDVEEQLRQSDGMVLPPEFIRGVPNIKLLRDRWVCMVGSEAPVGDEVTTEDLAQLPWVAPFGPSLFSSTPPVRQLRAMGIEPRVEVSVDGFQAVPYFVAGTDRIAFVPERLAQRLTSEAGLRLLPSPLPRNEHLMCLYWDPIDTNDPGHRWFRDVLRRAADAAMQQPLDG
jgi:DNA-binding transcriptional LysR family regulator